MESLLSFQFWLFAIVFLVAIHIVWLVPGSLILKALRIKLEPLAQSLLAFAVGFCLWGAQAYIFGFANVRFLTFLYVVSCVFLTAWQHKYFVSQSIASWKSIRKLPKALLLLLGVGVVIQVLQMVGTGLVYGEGMAFFRVHMQDGIYHLSMIQSMVRSLPPQEPGAAGVLVQNYHYWSDMIFAELVRIFRIPANYLFFQYLPPILSLFTGLSVVSLLQLWTKRKAVWFFGLFILFFGADAGYLVAWLIHGVFSFQYPVIDNGATQFLNMPHVAAKLIFLISLSALTMWFKEIKWKWGVVTLFLTAVLFGLKIYFALYAVLGLAVVGLIALISRNFPLVKQLLVLGVIGGVMALAIYLPPNHNSAGLGFFPLEWPKLMLAEANLDWRDWRYKLAVAELEHQEGKIVLYDIEAIAVTLMAIHGTRILGMLWTRKTGKELGATWVAYLIIPSLIFTFLGLYTLQAGGSNFNVYNFFASSLAPMGLLCAFLFADIWNWKVVGKFLVAVLVVVTLPRIIFETQKILVSYRDHTDVLYISRGEISALNSIDHTFPSNCIISSSFNNATDMNTPLCCLFFQPVRLYEWREGGGNA